MLTQVLLYVGLNAAEFTEIFPKDFEESLLGLNEPAFSLNAGAVI